MPLLAHPTELVDRILVQDEVIVFEDSPDLKVWLAGQWFEISMILVTVCVIFAAGIGVVRMIGAIAVVAMLASLGWRMADHFYTRYVLTDHRAIRVSGVVHRDYEWMTWSKVTDVSVHRSIADRLFGTATIKIQSANEASGFAAMSSLSHPVEFADHVAGLVRLRQGTVRRPQGR